MNFVRSVTEFQSKVPFLSHSQSEEMVSETCIGTVTHYFGKIGVAVLALTDPIHIGDKIRIRGNDTEFDQEVTSLQVDHEAVDTGQVGTEVAMQVTQSVRRGCQIYKLLA